MIVPLGELKYILKSHHCKVYKNVWCNVCGAQITISLSLQLC